ncbi:MAG TPA: type II toxin-antitoxin system RelE/ParE family toxin [Mucilaginibacter sp.]|jgi:plasmid stabilization system protein ParE|nr:type II toxin-antitoxin system RelE/ParE family toxin [Mucilaginibacter sp.]
MFEIIFSEKARDTFQSIQSQLFERWGVDIVIQFEKRTWDVIETLSESPFIFQSSEIDSSIRKVVVHKNCSLFYKVNGGKVELLFFWDNRQEPIF